MNSPLLYLVWLTLRNGLVTRIKRLRKPKYLLAAAVGGAYFYFYFYKFLFGGGMVRPPFSAPFLSDTSWEIIAAAVLLAFTLLFAWIFPGSRAALTFTQAEISFLFPAPVSRRVLVLYKLLKSQAGILFIGALVTFLTGRFRAGGEAWYRVGGWWIILNTLSMHRIGASFALQRLREFGMADNKRRFVMVIAAAALVASIEVARRSLPPLPALWPGTTGMIPDVNGYLSQLAQSGPLPYILAPFRWVVAPYFAHDALTFLQLLLPALGVMLFHFIWVLRADVAFEEASIAASQKRAALIAAAQKGEFRVRKRGARTPLWRLGSRGFIPTAFLWKSLLKFGGARNAVIALAIFSVLACGASALHWYDPRTMPAGISTLAVIMGIGAYGTLLLSFILVGQSATTQLRQGMLSIDLLKTYPLRGWQLALGELIGPIVVGTLLQWASLIVGVTLVTAVAPPQATPYVITVAFGFAVLLPAVNVSMSVLPSASSLLFPGWFKPQEGPTQGLEATGLRLLIGIAQFAAMVGMLLPVAFFGGCMWVAAGMFAAPLLWKAGLAAGLAALVLAVEAALGIYWLGSLYDRYDVSES